MRSRVIVGTVLAACLVGCALAAIAQQPESIAPGPGPRITPFQRLQSVLRGEGSLAPQQTATARQEPDEDATPPAASAPTAPTAAPAKPVALLPRDESQPTVVPAESTLEEGQQPLIRLAVPHYPSGAATPNLKPTAETITQPDAPYAGEPMTDEEQSSSAPPASAAASQPPRGILAPFFARNHLDRNNRSPLREPLFFNRANQSSPTTSTQSDTPAPAIASAPLAAAPSQTIAQGESIARTTAPIGPKPSSNQDDNIAPLMLAERAVAPPAIAPPRPDRVMIYAPTPRPQPEPDPQPSPAATAQAEPELAAPPTTEVTTPQVTAPHIEAPQIATTDDATPEAAAPEIAAADPITPAPIPQERVLTIDRNNPPEPTLAQRQPRETAPPVLRPVTPEPPAIPQLSVYMAGPAKVLHGEYASIKVRVVNTGSGAARDVILDVAGNDQLLKTMPIGAVPPGRSVEVELQLTPQVLGNLELQAVAKASDGERAVAVRTMFVGQPRISLAIAGPGTIHHGEVQLYTAIVDNQGNADAQEVSLLVMLQGKEAQSLTVGNVLAGQRRRITFELRPEHGGTLALNAVATCVGGVQAVANGSINVLKQDIELALDGPRQLRLGEAARYTLSVSNQGNVDAGVVTVNVSLGESVLDGLFEAQLAAGEQKQVMFEVSPSQPGRQTLTAVALTDNGAKAATTARLQVQHGQLELAAAGPTAKFSGGNATYDVTIKNVGDAPAEDVLITAHLPQGAEYLQGVERIDFYEGVTWRAGELAPGEQQTYHLECLLDTPGEQSITFSAAGAGEISATREVVTTVEALADIRLFVADPQGLVELGEHAVYEIELHNRGVKAAHDVQVKMLLGDALRPRTTEGLAAELNESGVLFEAIEKLDPKETRKIRVVMQAQQPGSHQFRVEVSALDPQTFVATEGTTRFYAKAQPIGPAPQTQLPIERMATPPQTPLR